MRSRGWRVVAVSVATLALAGCASQPGLPEFESDQKPGDVITGLALDSSTIDLDVDSSRLVAELDGERIFVVKARGEGRGQTCLVFAVEDIPNVACSTGLPLESSTADGTRLYLSPTPPPKDEDWSKESDSVWSMP